MPTILVIRNIGNVFIVILFSRHRKNACSLYLLCAAVLNFLSLTFVIPMNVYNLDHEDLGNHSIASCLILPEAMTVFGYLSYRNM